MKAKGLVWTLLLLLLGGGGCQPSAPQAKAFLDAAKCGDMEQVKALLKGNPNLVFNKDANGMTALHWAANYGHKDTAELLLASKANVNAKNTNGATPLHSAAGSGDKDTAELLLANKAEADAKANDGRTPLHLAAWLVCSFLVQNGYRIESRCSTAERGIDICAEKSSTGQTIHVEAKGATSSVTTSNRFGKPYTESQVFDRVAKGFYTVFQMKGKGSGDTRYALAVPDSELFLKYLAPVKPVFEAAGIGVFLVRDGGQVRVLNNFQL